mmetsp:Transcript_44939/g.68735  ORF Transcript_44939/g.68735 Transcript_44939/m.68735 type:complete len:222 (+) Transcript_44939:66-731(+)
MTVTIFKESLITCRSEQEHSHPSVVENTVVIEGLFELGMIQDDGEESTITSWLTEDEGNDDSSISSLDSQKYVIDFFNDRLWHDIDFPVSSGKPKNRRQSRERLEGLIFKTEKSALQRQGTGSRGRTCNHREEVANHSTTNMQEHQNGTKLVHEDDSLQLNYLRKITVASRKATTMRPPSSNGEQRRITHEPLQYDFLVNGLSPDVYILSLNDSMSSSNMQ